MAYTNSSLAAVTVLSPNHSGQRTHSIDRISPHCVVGQCTAEGLGEWFARTSTQASSNYGIDKDGRVGMYVEEKNRSWCTSSNANDQRAITIECASDKTEPYTMLNIIPLESHLFLASEPLNFLIFLNNVTTRYSNSTLAHLIQQGCYLF